MRLIDADEFLKEILTAGIGKTIIEYSESNIGYMIRRQPTVDAAPLVHERWIDRDRRLSCPVCGNQVHLGTDDPLVREIEKFNHKFCPHCGAKMDDA